MRQEGHMPINPAKIDMTDADIKAPLGLLRRSSGGLIGPVKSDMTDPRESLNRSDMETPPESLNQPDMDHANPMNGLNKVSS